MHLYDVIGRCPELSSVGLDHEQPRALRPGVSCKRLLDGRMALQQEQRSQLICSDMLVRAARAPGPMSIDMFDIAYSNVPELQQLILNRGL